MARTITDEEFGALFRAVGPELVGYLRRRGAVDVEDLVAEVFATAWRRREDLPPPVLRRAWLFGTARRTLLGDVRRVRREGEAVAELALTHDDEGTGDAVESATHLVVLAALARLAPAARELIELTEWERLTPAEIAVALGIRPGAARVRLHRARQALASDPEMQALVRRSSGQELAGRSPEAVRGRR